MRRPTASRLGATQVALVVVLLAALLGALVGGLLGAARSVSSTATALVAVQPDSPVSANADATIDPDVDVSDAFVQTELVYLGSDQYVSGIESAAGGDVDLEATRVNQSNVVQLSATADSPEVALAAAGAAASTYVDQRVQSATDRLDAQATAVQEEIDVVLAQIASATTGSVLPPDAGAVSALQGRYENLLTLSSSVSLARQSVDRGARLLQPPVLAEPDGVPASALGVVLGALAGALLGAGAALAWRRRSTTVRGEDDLVGVEGVLAPRGPRTPAELLLPVGAGATSELARAAQRQSAQLLAGRGEASAVVVLVGAGAGAGTSVLAAHHAAAMARRAPVVLVCAGDVVPGVRPSLATRLPGVDAGAAGLTDIGGGRAPLTDGDVLALLQRSGVEDLLVLTAGTGEGSSSALERLLGRGLLDALRATGHDVVVDAPPLDRSGAASRLADQADAVAVVVGVGASGRDDVAVAVRALERDGVAPALLLDEPASGGSSSADGASRGAGHGRAGTPPAGAADRGAASEPRTEPVRDQAVQGHDGAQGGSAAGGESLRQDLGMSPGADAADRSRVRSSGDPR